MIQTIFRQIKFKFRLYVKILIFVVCAKAFFVIYYGDLRGITPIQFLEYFSDLIKYKKGSSPKAGYIFFSPECKILDLDPWDKTIRKYIIEPPPLICSRLPLLTYIEQRRDLINVLKINKKVIKKYKKNRSKLHCCYNVITRVNQNVQDYNSSADSLYELSACINFTDQAVLSNDSEFIMVKCVSYRNGKKKQKEVYRDVHAVTPVLPNVLLKTDRISKNNNLNNNNNNTTKSIVSALERPNVIIVGIDSVSKLNLRRIMPKTLKYLQENHWVELNGYNKIGENTFPNLMAILSGERDQKLAKLCSAKMDDCPFIWKEYNKKGYVTLYAEDTPALSTFNFLRNGFVEKPTDYYMRPFMVAAHNLLPLKRLNGLPVCLGPVLVVDHIFNYAKRFLRAFNTSNHFSLLWLNSLSHNDLNAPKALDDSVVRFLNDLTELGTYENSLILLLSDHGVRFGDIRETYIGHMEERLPFLFVWYPKWFREKFPEKYHNLLINQNRLTSPYDVHVTIKKILDEEFEGKTISPKSRESELFPIKPVAPACPKCNGLLERQPLDRTCADASVDLNWCLCSKYLDVKVTDERANLLGAFLYKFIVDQTNELIRKQNVTKSLCSNWEFSKIFRTLEVIVPKTPQQYSIRNSSNDEIERFTNQIINLDTKIFVIILQLNPGKTKFEATVSMKASSSNENASFVFLEPPKRLDSIYKTSRCVKSSALLKHYCYCKKK